MTRAYGVIGAAYGDEGKGLLTDFLAERACSAGRRTVVVRFNGGAQAGHTVTRPDGRRHVFQHWASGALAGASTHLGPRFVAHPMLFAEETQALEGLGARLTITADPRVRVTTPLDVMINQAAEAARGAGRHGSCGVGFGEACARNEDPAFALTLAQVAGWSDMALRTFLGRLVHDYAPDRLRALGLDLSALGAWATNSGVLNRFVADCRALLDRVALAPSCCVADFDAIVFEGAQGLALDEKLGDFPYVTRSHTGVPYLLETAEEAGLEAVDVTYCTRAYTTRHGAGPLPFETAGPTAPGFFDATNLPNPYQGTMRFAPLLVDDLRKRVFADLARATSSVRVRHGVLVSCLDQVSETVDVAGHASVSRGALAEYVRTALSGSWAAESWGPSHENVRFATN